MSTGVLGHEVGMRPQPVACALDVDDYGMMQETVEQRGRDDRVPKHLAPFGKAPVRGQDHRAFLVAMVDQLEEQVRATGRDGQVTDFVNNQQAVAAEEAQLLWQASVALGAAESVDDLGQGGTVDPFAGPDGLDAQSGREMEFAGARRAQQMHDLRPFDEVQLRLVGLDWTVPDFSTLSRRQKTLAVNIPYRGSKGPPNLLIDSTGIKSEGEGEWNARKHGGPKRRIWRKIHIGIDEETLEVRAVEVTTSNVGDAPMLPELPNQIPPDQDVGSVTADGAYDTRKCHDAIAAPGAHAVIPPRKNAKPWKPNTAGAVARNDAVNASRYLGRTIWKRWSGYHRRSRVETKMHCVKRLGQSLMAQVFDRQVAEVQIRIAVLNRYTTLGIPVTEPVG